MLEPYRKLFLILGASSRRRFYILALLSLGSAFLQVVGVGSVFPLMTLVADPSAFSTSPHLVKLSQITGIQSKDAFFAFSGFFMILAILAGNAANVFVTWYTQRFLADEGVRLSDLLLQKYSYKSYLFFLSNDSTAMCRDVLAEVGVFLGAYVTPLLDLVVRPTSILVLGAGLIYVNPTAAIGSSIIFGGGYLVVYWLCSTKLEELGQIRIDSEVRKYKITFELFQGQREARLLNCREHFFKLYSQNSRKQNDAVLYTSLISQLPRQVIEVLGFALVFALILLFRAQGKIWDDILPLLSIFAVGAIRMMPQFQSLFASIATLRSAKPVVDRLLPEFTSLIDHRCKSAEPLQWSDSIEIRDLEYRYPETDVKVLSGMSFKIPKGAHVGFVGSTGAGKTTLINIILGLFSPDSGHFLIDGKEVTDERLLAWQASFGFVPQDIFLCNDTVAANIAFGVSSEDIDMARVREAAKLASLAEHIESLPEGYDTKVGERGVRFSGGQRQRLGIARALYREPTTLVLDEATSALDGHTEDTVMDSIRDVGGDKTLLIIAHRLTTLKECDTIFVLEQGKVVDTGTYEELLSQNETFRAFAKLAPN